MNDVAPETPETPEAVDTHDTTDTQAAPETQAANEPQAQDTTDQGQQGRQSPDAPQDDIAGSDWRSRMSGGDEDKLKRLERYASEEAVVDALISAQQKISSGEYKKPLSDNPTEEELAAYREEMGIPEDPSKYEYKLPEGFNFSDHEQPLVDNFLAKMHESNTPPSQVQAALDAYVENLEQQAVQIQEMDRKMAEEVEDALRAEYGSEYRANKNRLENFLSTAPESVRDKIMHGRGPDQTALMNDIEFVRWMNGVVHELNPAGTLIKNDGRDTVQSIQDERAVLEGVMKEKLKDGSWHKSPEREKYMKLLEAEEKVSKRQ